MLWFRLHAKILHDPIVQTLEPEIYRFYINCLCYAAEREEGGNLGEISEISFVLRETKSSVSSAFHVLEKVGLIETVGETFHIPQWKKKQYKSDTSTERVKKYRAKRKRSRNVTVTAPEQSRTDIKDNDKSLSKNSGSKSSKQKGLNRGKRIDAEFGEDWHLPEKYLAYAIGKEFTKPEIEIEFEKFTNYWKAKSGSNAIKRDWLATWRSWVLNAAEWRGGNGNNPNRPSGGGGTSVIDITAEIIAERDSEVA